MPRKFAFENETVRNSILSSIRIGASNKDACLCAGLSEAVFYLWQQAAELGARSETPTRQQRKCLEFFEDVKAAEAKCKDDRLRLITRAALGGHWQAAAWMLERKFPDEFGLRARSDEIARQVDAANALLLQRIGVILTEFLSPEKAREALLRLREASIQQAQSKPGANGS